MERFFRSLKTEWIPEVGYASFEEAKRGITNDVVGYYSQFRPHTHNDGLAPNEADSIGLTIKLWPKRLDHYSHHDRFEVLLEV